MRGTEDRTSSAPSREVNNLLHTLRGEHFRHSRNLLKSKAHRIAVSETYHKPSLPFSDIYQSLYSEDEPRPQEAARVPIPVIYQGQLQHDYPRGPIPGPLAPKSWKTLAEQSAQGYNTTAFRREALSLVFAHTSWSLGSSDVPLASTSASVSPIPPLTQICLRALLAEFPGDDEFRDELLPLLPPHFYRDVMRYSAVHEPLSNAKLYALCEPDGHVDGELIVIGPQATLPREVLGGLSPTLSTHREREEEQEDEWGEGSSRQSTEAREARPRDVDDEGEEHYEDFEAEEDTWDAHSTASQDTPPPIHTLIVLNTDMAFTTLFVLPPTLTRLALIALPAPTQVHRLPRICPLLEVVDFSYNPWLNDPPGARSRVNAESFLERIEWEKWARLRVLGLRGCNTLDSITRRVNKGRWDDVQIIGIESATSSASISSVEGMMRGLHLSD